MLVSELIEILKKVDQDTEIVVPTTINTFIRPTSYGLIRLLPIVPGSEHDKRNYRLNAGREWREPVNGNDEPETKREWGFIIR